MIYVKLVHAVTSTPTSLSLSLSLSLSHSLSNRVSFLGARQCGDGT
eukprot:COSAG06_NODE_62565_length_264_cov_1.581818_1_plen_45_part_01